MAQYGLEPNDVFAAIGGQSFVAATGSLGEQSENAYQYSMEYKGTLKTVEEFKDIVLRTSEGGHLLHLGEVADVEIGAVISGYGMMAGRSGSCYATLIIRLKNWDDCPGMNHNIMLVYGRFAFDCKEIKNAKCYTPM